MLTMFLFARSNRFSRSKIAIYNNPHSKRKRWNFKKDKVNSTYREYQQLDNLSDYRNIRVNITMARVRCIIISTCDAYI